MSSSVEQIRSSGTARVREIISALKAAHDHSLDACEKPLQEIGFSKSFLTALLVKGKSQTTWFAQ